VAWGIVRRGSAGSMPPRRRKHPLERSEPRRLDRCWAAVRLHALNYSLYSNRLNTLLRALC